MYSEPSIIFDMDGVLWSTSKYHKLAYENSLSNYLNFDCKIDYSLVAGMSTVDGLKVLLGSYSIKNEDYLLLKNNKQRMFLEMEVSTSDLNWPLINFIHQHHRKVNCILATSASVQSCRKFLNLSSLNNIFRKILTSNDVLNSKPHPEIYQKAVEGFNLNNSVVIEDSMAGIVAAENAGISNIFVLKEYSSDPEQRITNGYKEFVNSMDLIECLTDHFLS